jgi:hypothetical protein
MGFDAAASSESFDVADCFLWLGAVLVVGIDIRGADDSGSVHDEASRHRQSPAVVAIAHRKVIAEADRRSAFSKADPVRSRQPTE